jgi:hypothetical protein
MEITIILRDIEKGNKKGLNSEIKNLNALLQSETVQTCGFWIKTLVDNWSTIQPVLAKVYELPKLSSNADKKAFLLQCMKNGAPLVNESGTICRGKLEKTETEILLTYSVMDKFTFRGVYNFIFKPRKQTVVLCDVVYKRVTELTIKSTEVKTTVLKPAV